MNIKNIPCGNKVPEDIYVIIEISLNNSFVKYEICNKYNLLFIDRFIKTPMFYPCNYGFINKTISGDNDNIDCIIICSYVLNIGSIIHCRPIGVLKMIDECGEDNKIICVPNYEISNEYDNINNIIDIPKNILDKILFFFKNYKKLDKNKWVKILGWYDIYESKKIILKSYNLFKKKIK